jgi:large conductance mechanosensitive channel
MHFRKKEDKKTETPSEEVMYLKEITELLKKNKE